MSSQRRPSTPPTRGFLARWRAARRPRRVPPPSAEDWGMESALPWLQAERRPY
ncbi:MAG: hypothetical protein JO224_13545 [Pelomonas sp.]|nr:hypothetical protein [Roseateles sp.]